MSGKNSNMRVPWLATLDALIDELNRHLETPVSKFPPEITQRPVEYGVIEFVKKQTFAIEERGSDPRNDEDALTSAVEALVEARMILKKRRTLADKSALTSKASRINGQTLEKVDEQWLRYPDLEALEGLARFVEPGGLFGPMMGEHIASVIRGESKYKGSSGYTFEEAWRRRFAVKRIATIQHVYDVSRKKAIEMFCDFYEKDDPEASAPDKYKKWVTKDQKMALDTLAKGNLEERDEKHLRGLAYGLCTQHERGCLKNQVFPEAMKQILRNKGKN